MDTSFKQALDEVLSHPDWMSYIDDFKAGHVAGTMPYIDLEEFARLLANGPDTQTATELYNHLQYWKDKGRI